MQYLYYSNIMGNFSSLPAKTVSGGVLWLSRYLEATINRVLSASYLVLAVVLTFILLVHKIVIPSLPLGFSLPAFLRHHCRT